MRIRRKGIEGGLTFGKGAERVALRRRGEGRIGAPVLEVAENEKDDQ